MFFYDLLKQVNKIDVINYLSNVEYARDYLDSFSKMFDNILTIAPTFNSKLHLFLVEQKDYHKDKKNISVLGFDYENNERYALEFLPWSDWLGLNIIDKSLEKFGIVAFVSECLNNMSMISFNEETIKKEKEILIERDNKLKNGEEKTYTLEEVEEHFEKVFGIKLERHKKSEEELEEESKRIKDIMIQNDEYISEMVGRKYCCCDYSKE